ncbi:MAG: hypothetical protein L3J75_16490 [Methylococcaceae bacterium]|nr:hypothetical protein [Methylococcaceae bacterium]
MIYIFTSCALNYTPKARILVESVREFVPNVRFCLALADKARSHNEELLKYFDEVIAIDDIDEINDPSWIFKHEIVELATAIKPFVLRKILEKEDCEAVFYFDPDIALFSDLDEMIDELSGNNILLTPHLTDPEKTTRGIEDNELSALRHGVYNLGYIGVSNTIEGRRFVDWWASRLKEYCREDIPAGIFTDQRWIDLVPAFFEGVKSTRHPGYNVAPWNMTNRHIEKNIDGKYTVNNQPLVFYHFTGFDSGAHHDMMSIYSNNSPVAVELFNWYENKLEKTDNDPLAATPWAYGVFDDSQVISKLQRTVYRTREDLYKAFSNPFEVDSSNEHMTYKAWWDMIGSSESSKQEQVEPAKTIYPTANEFPLLAGRHIFVHTWNFLGTHDYRKRAIKSIINTYRLWGVKGVISLVSRKAMGL